MSRDSIVDLPGLHGSRAVVVLFGDSLTQRGFQEAGWAGQLANHYGRRADVFNRGYGGYNSRWGKKIIFSMFPTPPTMRQQLTIGDNRGKYFLATVWFGANDASAKSERSHVPLLEFSENIEAILEHLKTFFLNVVVMSPPPVHTPKRLAWRPQKYGVNTAEGNLIDRSDDLAGTYGRAAEEVVQRIKKTKQSNLLQNAGVIDSKLSLHFLDIWQCMNDQGEDVWQSYLEEDGLHLSPLGNDFVAKQLTNLLDNDIFRVESLPPELPWGSNVNPNDFVTSFQQHQLNHQLDRIGVGEFFISEMSTRSSLDNNHAVLSVIAIVLWIIFVLYTLFNYFSSGYFRVNKEN